MSSTIQVRTDPATKKAAQIILRKLGIDLSTAINLYLVQIIEKRGLPFEVLTANGFTEAEEQAILREVKEAINYGKRYSSNKEMFEDILRE